MNRLNDYGSLVQLINQIVVDLKAIVNEMESRVKINEILDKCVASLNHDFEITNENKYPNDSDILKILSLEYQVIKIDYKKTGTKNDRSKWADALSMLLNSIANCFNFKSRAFEILKEMAQLAKIYYA